MAGLLRSLERFRSRGGVTGEASQLNGAQIAAAKDIVVGVANGELPRETGLAMLKRFFGLDDAGAESIMGPAGTSTPTTPNPRPTAVDSPA